MGLQSRFVAWSILCRWYDNSPSGKLRGTYQMQCFFCCSWSACVDWQLEEVSMFVLAIFGSDCKLTFFISYGFTYFIDFSSFKWSCGLWFRLVPFCRRSMQWCIPRNGSLTKTNWLRLFFVWHSSDWSSHCTLPWWLTTVLSLLTVRENRWREMTLEYSKHCFLEILVVFCTVCNSFNLNTFWFT